MSTRRLLSNFCITAAVLSLFIVPTNGATVSSAPAQTFSGVGGSGAWWPMDLFHFPEAARQNLSDLLFSQSGLGLSSYRWNIGGGGKMASELFH